MLKKLWKRSTNALARGADHVFVEKFIKTGNADARKITPEEHAERLVKLDALLTAQSSPRFYEDPNTFFPPPPPARPFQERVRDDVFAWTWDSDYTPFRPAVTNILAQHPTNNTAHTRLYQRPGEDRPVAILVHGYRAGFYTLDEKVWPVTWLLDQGFDVALFVLPNHGPRLARGTDRPLWPHPDVRLTIEGARQAIWDLRALMGALRARRRTRVGVVGMSLGGFIVSLLATVEPDLDFCVPLIPLASFADWGKDHGTIPGTPDQRYELFGRLEKVTHIISPMARPSQLSPEQIMVMAGDVDGINQRHHSDMLAEHFGARVATFRGGHVLQFGRADAFEQALTVMRGA